MSGIENLFNIFAAKAKAEELDWTDMIGLGELYSQLLGMPEQAQVVVEYYGVPVWAGYLSSYRGYYEDLSFDLDGQTTVAEVLDQIVDLLDGESYEGYKGGEYCAHYDTLVWASQYADCSGVGVTGVELIGDRVYLTTVDTNDN